MGWGRQLHFGPNRTDTVVLLATEDDPTLLIEGGGLVERLAAINVSKDTKTVTLNDALLDRRPEGIVVSHTPPAYVTHQRAVQRHKSTHMLKGRGREREEDDED